jgi:hypothetical protein
MLLTVVQAVVLVTETLAQGGLETRLLLLHPKEMTVARV